MLNAIGRYRIRCNMNGIYEYVPRSEYEPVRIEANIIICAVQNELRPQGLTFQPMLVGSGRRHMVTRIKGGNGGFDLDYNIELHIPEGWGPRDIHAAFINALRRALDSTPYSDPEESTSSFTVKLVDHGRSRVVHSIDIAIVVPDNDRMQHYLRYNKPFGSFSFEPRGYRFNDRTYVDEIKEYYKDKGVDGWQLVLDEYLKLKNSNRDPCKKSLDLYTEAVRNVHSRLPGSIGYATILDSMCPRLGW